MSASDRIAIWVETGGDLPKDRQFFRFGKRVETVHLTNNTSTARLFDVQVARDPVFYIPVGISGGHVNRREVQQETYFYVVVAANSSYSSPPFFAERGLKVKAQGTLGRQCSAQAAVYGVNPGDCITKGQLP